MFSFGFSNPFVYIGTNRMFVNARVKIYRISRGTIYEIYWRMVLPAQTRGTSRHEEKGFKGKSWNLVQKRVICRRFLTRKGVFPIKGRERTRNDCTKLERKRGYL